ncbi:hypothetical protein KR200_005496, partial [Drosophila serrata]
ISLDSNIFSIWKSDASGMPAITLSPVLRKSKLLAVLWCTFNTDNKSLIWFVSMSNSFRICDTGNNSVNLAVSSIIVE